MARYGDGNDQLYWRINDFWVNTGTLPQWEYSTHVHDYSLHDEMLEECGECSYEPPADFVFTMSVVFPPHDLPVVLQRLREHNAQQ